MYLIINDVPINVFSIKKIAEVDTINGSIYAQCLKFLCSSYGRDSSIDEATTDYFLASSVKKLGYRTKKPYTKILEHINEMVMAIEGREIFDPMPGNADKYRFLDPDEIRWEIIPDTYFFGVRFNGDMCGLSYLDDICGNELFTGSNSSDVCIYSDIYYNLEEITKLRQGLIDEVNMISSSAPKIKI